MLRRGADFKKSRIGLPMLTGVLKHLLGILQEKEQGFFFAPQIFPRLFLGKPPLH